MLPTVLQVPDNFACNAGPGWLQLYWSAKMTGRLKLNVSVWAIFLTILTFLLTFHQFDSNNLISDVTERHLLKGTEILRELNGEDINTCIYSDYKNLCLRKWSISWGGARRMCQNIRRWHQWKHSEYIFSILSTFAPELDNIICLKPNDLVISSKLKESIIWYINT